MNSLRFLLVHRSPAQSDVISDLLTRANHSVLATSGLAEAADALTVERFDAVLMDAAFRSRGLEEFSSQLRKLQQDRRNAVRVPLIGLAPLPFSHPAIPLEELNGPYLDAVVPEPIDPFALTATVLKLAEAVTQSGLAGESMPSLFDPVKFKEQVGFDHELMIEIIDLFLSERERQEPEMREALMAADFELLCRLAHTIKGSLGSLHAMQARAHAEDLELAAKYRKEEGCWQSLSVLEADLAELEPYLLELRAS